MRAPADSVRATPRALTMTCGRLPGCSCRHGTTLDGPETPSGRTATCGITPSTIMSPAPNRPRTEIRLGARAHTTANRRWPYAHAPPKPNSSKSPTRTPRLTRGPWTDTEQCCRPTRGARLVRERVWGRSVRLRPPGSVRRQRRAGLRAAVRGRRIVGGQGSLDRAPAVTRIWRAVIAVRGVTGTAGRGVA
jgi:hypothetical protein